MAKFSLKVPVRFEGLTIEEIEPRDRHQEHALAKTTQWLDNQDSRGFLFVGPPGRGKTMFASAVVNSLPIFQGGFLQIGHYERLLRRKMDLKAAWDRGYDDTAYRTWQQIDHALTYIQTELPVLALDDLGKEHHTSSNWMQDEIDWLLRHRFDQGLATLGTSNLPPEKFGATYSPAMKSFIGEAYDLITLAGEDYR